MGKSLVRTSRGFPCNPSLRDRSKGALRPEGSVTGGTLYVALEFWEALDEGGAVGGVIRAFWRL
jgi:hypothetical protein